MRRDEEHILRKVLSTDIVYQEEGREDDRKTRWKDACQRDLKSTGLKSGSGDGQGDVEKEDQQSFQRIYMTRKARGKEEQEGNKCVAFTGLLRQFHR